MTSRENRLAFTEFIFWFAALSFVKLIVVLWSVLFLKSDGINVNPRQIIFSLFKGNFMTAILITLLNRLWQYIVRRYYSS